MDNLQAAKPLSDYVGLQRGNTYKGALLGQDGPVLLGLASIARNGGFRSDNLKTYGGPSDERMLLKPGDIYVSLKDVTQSADLLGAVARVPNTVSQGRLTQDTVKLNFKDQEFPKTYIYWILRTPQYRAYCKAHATGTTNLGLPRDDFLAFAIPPLTPVRRTLLQLLQSLDDNIDLTRRMNQTLEATARAIFKDWFVEFGPTRAKAEGREPYLAPELWDLFPDAIDDEGKPVGWHVSVLGDWIQILDSKRIPLSSRERKKRQGPYPYHGATGVMDYVDGFLFDGVHVLVGEDGSVAKPNGSPFTQYVWGQFWVNNHAHVLRGNGISNETLLCFLQQTDVTPYVTGAVQPKLNQRNLKAIPFPALESEVARAFGMVVEPLFEQVRLNSDQSRTLAETRDLLLPKLMSGEIRLPKAKNAVETVA